MLSDVQFVRNASTQAEQSKRGRGKKGTAINETQKDTPDSRSVLASAIHGRPGKKPYLARIYGFAYEGHYYDLARPLIFVVHGDGEKVEGTVEKTGMEKSGVATAAAEYAKDLLLWRCDKSDISIRLEAESGTFEKILLEGELRSDKLKTSFSGVRAARRPTGPDGNE